MLFRSKVRLVEKLIASSPGHGGPPSWAKLESMRAANSRRTGAQPVLTAPSHPSAPRSAHGPMRVCVIGASTGGPRALVEILSTLDGSLPLCVLIVQHMPDKFTTAFAERLDRVSSFEVREAQNGDLLAPGLALVAPGAAIMTVERLANAQMRVRVAEPGPEDRFVPSIDKVLVSAAHAAGQDVLAVVLTGMGSDGSEGVRRVHEKGGRAIAESERTAVIFGMPEEAIKTGAVDETLPLDLIAAAITKHAKPV